MLRPLSTRYHSGQQVTSVARNTVEGGMGVEGGGQAAPPNQAWFAASES